MVIIGKICMDVHLLIMVLLLLFISAASCLQCYKCYGSTNRDCYNGDPEYLAILNCSKKSDVCITYQYETVAGSNPPYVTTIRGCHPITEESICNQVMKTKSSRNVVEKGIRCETCSTDLCNSSTTMRLSSTVLLIIVVLYSIILKI